MTGGLWAAAFFFHSRTPLAQLSHLFQHFINVVWGSFNINSNMLIIKSVFQVSLTCVLNVVSRTWSSERYWPPYPTPPHPIYIIIYIFINDKNDPKHTGHRSRRHQLTSQRLGQVCRVLKILLAWIILFSSWKLVHFGDIHHFEANPEGLCSKAHSPVMKWDAHEMQWWSSPLNDAPTVNRSVNENWDFLVCAYFASLKGRFSITWNAGDF